MKFFLYVRPLNDLSTHDSPIQLGPYFGLKVEHTRITVLRRLDKKEREEAKRRDQPEYAWVQIAAAEVAYTPATYGTDADGKPVQKSAPSSGTVWTFYDLKSSTRPTITSTEWSIDD